MGCSKRKVAHASRFIVLALAACGCSGSSPDTASQNRGSGGVDTTAAGAAAGGAGGSNSTAGASGTASNGGSAEVASSAGGQAGAAGAGAGPPLVLHPVATWGGKALNMVPFAISGSRLEATGYAGDDAVVFGKLRDTQLGFDCAFELTEGGEWLCAPTEKRSLVYLDSGCTKAAVEEPAFSTPVGKEFGLEASNYTSSGGADTVLLLTHDPVYRVAEEVFASNGVDTYAEETLSIFTGTPNQCVGPRRANRHVVTRPPSVFRVSTVADSELIKAAVREVALESGLALERLVTEDGAQLSGHLKFAGRECTLQRDGRCVPAPVAERFLFANSACTEFAFSLPSGTDTGDALYGVEPAADDTSAVYELSRTTSVYTERADGSCEAIDVSAGGIPYYRRGREVSVQFPKLNVLQLGDGSIRPSWFFSTLAGTQTRVLVQMHSPDGDWVKPNVRTSNGSVCAVYDTRYPNQCLMKDGLSSVPVSPVPL